MPELDPERRPPLDSKRSLLSWTLGILRRHNIRPSKRLGQHFVVNPELVKATISHIAATRAEYVLEVGPGLGTVTHHLSDITRKIMAVEIDRRLARVSGSILPLNVLVIVGDGVPFTESVCADVVFSNTPYSASSRLIAAAARNNCINTAVYLVQKELAERAVAKPGSKDYGRLTLLVNRYFDAHLDGVYPPTSFHPQPDVSSALLILKRRRKWATGDELFEKLTACIFSGRNRKASKMLKLCSNRLGYRIGGVSSKWEELRVRDLRVEDIEEALNMMARHG